MNRLLITGASGFLGQHCLSTLIAQQRSDLEIHAVCRSAQLQQNHVQWHCADLLSSVDRELLLERIQPTHLLHLAWVTTPGQFYQSEQNDLWLAASNSLAVQFAQHGGRRIVGIGSCAEYEFEDQPCREEETPLRPNTRYGCAKRDCYIDWTGIAEMSNLSMAWGRLFFLYGPGASRLRIPGVIINHLLKQETVACSAGHQQRDFLYAPEAAEALVELTLSDVTGAVNIASGTPYVLKDLMIQTAQMMGDPELLELGKRPLSAHEPQQIVADISRLTNELGWTPKVDLTEGLNRTIAQAKQAYLHEQSLINKAA